MLKWIFCVVLVLCVGGSWLAYSSKSSDIDTIKNKITAINEAGEGDPDELLPKLQSDLHSLDAERTFTGILLTFLSAGVIGIFGVSYLIPFIAEKFSHSVYDSGEVAEKDVMHDARSLVAQGNYEGAIEAYKVAAAAEPLNRLPWVEIAKIQKDNLHDSNAAVATIRGALESQEWEVRDAAYFLFRLAELFDEVQGDRASAIEIMNQVIREFPETRHSANASHKLHEWSLAGEPDKRASEEAEFLAKMSQPKS
jgi:tetratricopeptide (TPR) repeat protein